MTKDLGQLKSLVEEELKNYPWPSRPAKVYEPQSYILSLGGKRMRPIASLMACELYNGNLKQALKPSLAIEFFHNFSLIHDDIMDEAPLRRGSETVHHKWDLNVGILSGDALLIKAYELFEDLEPALFKQAVKRFNATALGVCDGQQLDMDLAERTDASLEEYVEMISLKTAVLLGFSFELGAMIAGASKEDQQALYQMGMNLGIGFQIQDDLLDAYGDAAKFGKQVGGDIAANKQSYLLISALNSANETQKAEILNQLENGFGEEKIKSVLEIYQALDIAGKAKDAADTYFKKAKENLASLAANEEKKEPIKALINELWMRES